MKITFEKSSSYRDPRGAQPEPHTFEFYHGSIENLDKNELRRRKARNEPLPAPEWYADGCLRCLGGVTFGIPYRGGKWLIDIRASPDELKAWVQDYVERSPQEALDLIAEILPLAVAKLKEKENAS